MQQHNITMFSDQIRLKIAAVGLEGLKIAKNVPLSLLTAAMTANSYTEKHEPHR